MQPGEPLWTPGADRVAAADQTRFRARMEQSSGRRLDDYGALHQLSIERRDLFWGEVWDHCGVVARRRGTVVLAGADRMPGAPRGEEPPTRWFPEARLNFAENLLDGRGRRSDEAAIVFRGESGLRRLLTWGELRSGTAKVAAALRARGVSAGDRVASLLPNVPETIVAMLATASIGAIFSSSSPDFGTAAVLDRFGQIEPRVLFVGDGYWYDGKWFDTLARLDALVAGLPTVEMVVVVPYEQHEREPSRSVRHAQVLSLDELMASAVAGDAAARVLSFEALSFDHPLYVMYSSGTTGKPKCILHGAGGTLLQHLKEHRLHVDVKTGDRLFYFTTCGWMMWNWLASGLASGATLILYDGSPFHPTPSALFDLAAEERVTIFGTSAKFLDSAAKAALSPCHSHDLSALRTVLSTGSPLLPEGFDYVYREVKEDVHLASISGGTDILSCFVLGNPTAPVYRGEIQCAGLGMAVEVFDEGGRRVIGRPGELVCTRPFPSMPLGFWGDPDRRRYRAAYFERFPGVWHHGDWTMETERGGFVIYGRSDAVLNPGGVRIGTAEIYRQVERLDEVVESIAIGQEWDGDVRVVLFVKLRPGVVLDGELAARIKRAIRENTSPRHVPAKVLQVEDIPRTRSGKITELAVRDVVHGREVRNVGALANPEALEHFRGRPELAS
ncbi:MAG TPA: acetoacetate--CoA ligase [Thermoanaerobaculia bacterium]|nr:acetoacetate--CoA ligase [Thermoanaerobaculia bacterium]